MSRIKITNGFPRKTDAPIRLAIIVLDGDIQVNDQVLLADDLAFPILSIAFSNIIPSEKRAVITVSQEPSVEWHDWYGKELTVKTMSAAV